MRRALLVFAIWFVYGCQGFCQHIHDNHPKTAHGTPVIHGMYKRILLTDGPTDPVVVAGPQFWEVLVDHDESNGTCDPATASVEVERSVEHSVTIGGNITFGGSVESGANALFAKLKYEASAQVEFNGSYTSSSTETVTISSKNEVPPCKAKNYTFKKLKKTATGSITTYDHKIVCKCQDCEITETKYCNKVTLSGSAIGWGQTNGTWTNKGSIPGCDCGVAGDPPPVVVIVD